MDIKQDKIYNIQVFIKVTLWNSLKYINKISIIFINIFFFEAIFYNFCFIIITESTWLHLVTGLFFKVTSAHFNSIILVFVIFKKKCEIFKMINYKMPQNKAYYNWCKIIFFHSETYAIYK